MKYFIYRINNTFVNKQAKQHHISEENDASVNTDALLVESAGKVVTAVLMNHKSALAAAWKCTLRNK